MSYIASFCLLDISKNFAFGIGVGVGVGVVIRKIMKEKRKQKEHLISCLKQLAAEVRQLRETFIQSVSTRPSSVAQIGESSSEEEYFDIEKNCEKIPEDSVRFIEKVDSLFDGSSADKQDAYNMLITQANQEPDNCEVIWRYAKSQLQISNLKEQAGDVDAQQIMIEKGVKTAKHALELNNESCQAHQWYAILIGSSIQFKDNKEKILLGYEYKAHIEKAIELNPLDAKSYYLLGRYCYEIFSLPWYTRKAASALFAELPKATVDDALNNFLKAEEIKPGFWIDNSLFIGKCYYYKTNYKLATQWLQKVLNSASQSKEDEKTKEDAASLIRKC